jgi:hypothetical protein
VHIVFAAILVLALFTSFRAARPARGHGSQVLGAYAFLLGMCLVMAGSAFLGHGPGMRVAVALLFSSAAAEFLAGVLVILAASRLAKLASVKSPGRPRMEAPASSAACSAFAPSDVLLGEFWVAVRSRQQAQQP